MAASFLKNVFVKHVEPKKGEPAKRAHGTSGLAFDSLHTEGFLCRSHQPKVLIHQTFRQLTAAFISGNGLQSVCVLYV